MAELAGIIARVRSEIGDFGSPFRDDFTGGSELSVFDLSETNVDASSLSVLLVVVDGDVTELVAGVDYRVDTREGRLVLLGVRGPLAHGQALVVSGTGQGMFSDEELAQYVGDALSQHGYGRTVQMRYRDSLGFIRYTDDAITLSNLPPVEDPLLAYLAVTNVLWTLATDAASDASISTAEGTNVDRAGRYRQLMEHIDTVQSRYNALAQQLNVGLGRIEQLTLRRVSRTTNRLVPIYKEREFDDAAYPQRLIPRIDEPDPDESGIPSPFYPGVWG
ncbi:hypothetical protein [Streptomyces sp. CBMA29]|uniref:hypothetical protein n=1 Tax=Streptomyces sp. CBMA29 TaxID=1896314 RepID=UPI001661B760|nr:hypothetical protein [Streptomyces sp. CBMA29]MBD0734058.1 hypothetical protein [Streptomyces sp. CBMA29]